jgi:hypothetical protein
MLVFPLALFGLFGNSMLYMRGHFDRLSESLFNLFVFVFCFFFFFFTVLELWLFFVVVRWIVIFQPFFFFFFFFALELWFFLFC